MVPTVQALLDAIPASAAVLDPAGRIQLVNRRWIQFCVAEGGQPEVVSPPADYLAVCDRDTADGVRAVLGRDLDRFEMEYPCHGPDTERWFRMIVSPLDTGALVVHVDISGEYERVSRWLETTSQPMIELDPTGSAVFVNRAWADLQGAPRRTLLGAGWAGHLDVDDRTRLDGAVRATMSDRADRTTDVTVAAGDGGTLWMRFLVSADVDADQRLRRILLVGMDVTAARRLNDQLAASAERERIAADIHDVVIQDLLAIGLAIEKQRRLGAVGSSLLTEVTSGLDRSVADLRALSAKLPSQRLDLTDFDAVIRQAALALGFTPEVRFDVDLSRLSAPAAANLLPVMKEALSNVARHAHATRATVSVTEDRGDLVLTVGDNGVGMPNVPTRNSGTGNISRRAAELGGEAHWSGAEDGGTVLEWRIPLTLMPR